MPCNENRLWHVCGKVSLRALYRRARIMLSGISHMTEGGAVCVGVGGGGGGEQSAERNLRLEERLELSVLPVRKEGLDALLCRPSLSQETEGGGREGQGQGQGHRVSDTTNL